MKRLLYIRHGETEYNAQHIWSGRANTKLTEKGKRQAEAAGRQLAQREAAIDLVISSTAARSYESACIIAKQIEYPVSKIQKNSNLVERSFGILEGTPWEAFWADHTLKDLDNVSGGETTAALQERAERAYENLKSLTTYDTVLIVGHGAFGRALTRVIKGLPYADEYDERKRSTLMLDNGQIVELL